METSYFLWHYRWYIRIILFTGMIVSYRKVFEKRAWIPMITVFFTSWAFYMTNFVMTAEAFFMQPETIAFAPASDGNVPMDALVIGVTIGDESKAYPIRYLSFHHHVPDTIDGKAVMVTYCDVCRSGIVYAPEVDNKSTGFRLVGMDRFNAMLEDERTGSWFMQANGECVAGELKGSILQIVPSEQLTLSEWSSRHANGKVMLPDPAYVDEYDDGTFEKGKSTSSLTKTDTASWQDKSWVVGVELNGHYRVYDWRELLRNRSIIDTLAGQNIGIFVDDEGVNFSAVHFTNIIVADSTSITDGIPVETKPIPSTQMFWHTWKTFYPKTTRYVNGKIMKP